MFDKPFIIADVGSNWRRYDDAARNKECAIEHIRVAAECGVSAVKFQLFTHEELYGFPGDDTYALPREWLKQLQHACVYYGVEFMCTAFSAEGVRFVDPYVKAHKIASAEALHSGIWRAVTETQKPFLISTGGASATEIWSLIISAINIGKHNLMGVLECVAAYPAIPSDYNIGGTRHVMVAGIPLSQRAKLKKQKKKARWFGVSDHTPGTEVALVAIGLGATIFEKHFDALKNTNEWLDDALRQGGRLSSGPDFEVSIGRYELRGYVDSIRAGFSALGDGIKRPRESEADFVKYARRDAGMNTFRRKAP